MILNSSLTPEFKLRTQLDKNSVNKILSQILQYTFQHPFLEKNVMNNKTLQKDGHFKAQLTLFNVNLEEKNLQIPFKKTFANFNAFNIFL